MILTFDAAVVSGPVVVALARVPRLLRSVIVPLNARPIVLARIQLAQLRL